MGAQIDPLDLLAFIESGMSMTGEQIAARWPQWNKLKDEAYRRFERECAAYQQKWGVNHRGSSDPMVDSLAGCQYHWVYLPLIRAALAANASVDERPEGQDPQGLGAKPASAAPEGRTPNPSRPIPDTLNAGGCE